MFSSLPNPISLLYQSGLLQSTLWTLSECPPLTSRTAVITGGQSGIGAEIVRQLLSHDVGHVVVLARSREKFDLARSKWADEGVLGDLTGEGEGEGRGSRVEFVECDLTDLTVVDRVGKELVGRLGRLDMLFLNAAIPNIPTYTLSPQGVETIFAANHLGHFHLTNLLLPLLISTPSTHSVPSSRIVVSSSSLHNLCRSIDVRSLTSPTPRNSSLGVAYDSLYRYARSKLANILFARALSTRLPRDVFVNAYFPGNVPTASMDVWREHFGHAVGGVVAGVFGRIGQSLEEGAATAVYLAAARQVEVDGSRGQYWVPVAKRENCSAVARDDGLAETLWVWSEGFVKEALSPGQETG